MTKKKKKKKKKKKHHSAGVQWRKEEEKNKRRIRLDDKCWLTSENRKLCNSIPYLSA
jgi:hypothetical protein